LILEMIVGGALVLLGVMFGAAITERAQDRLTKKTKVL